MSYQQKCHFKEIMDYTKHQWLSMCILNIMYCDTLMYHSVVPSLANVQQKIPSSHYMIMNIKMYIQDQPY